MRPRRWPTGCGRAAVPPHRLAADRTRALARGALVMAWSRSRTLRCARSIPRPSACRRATPRQLPYGLRRRCLPDRRLALASGGGAGDGADADAGFSLCLCDGAHPQCPWVRKALLIALFLPFFIGQVVRAYGWLIILGNNGIVNDMLGLVGVAPLRFCSTSPPSSSASCSTCCPSPS